MQTFPSHEFDSSNNNCSRSIFQGQSSLMEILNVDGSSTVRTTKSAADTSKSAAASKNHSEAERRRRKRINSHLSTLRSLLPKNIKTDKASLLAEVVRRVKELKESTAELSAFVTTCNNDKYINNYKNGVDDDDFDEYIVPSETDELNLSYCDKNSGTLIKGTLCCEDRPELISDLTRALNSVQAKVVRAGMATVGGRTKIVLWLQCSNIGSDEDMAVIRWALRAVVDSATVMVSVSGQAFLGGNRPRICQ